MNLCWKILIFIFTSNLKIMLISISICILLLQAQNSKLLKLEHNTFTCIISLPDIKSIFHLQNGSEFISELIHAPPNLRLFAAKNQLKMCVKTTSLLFLGRMYQSLGSSEVLLSNAVNNTVKEVSVEPTSKFTDQITPKQRKLSRFISHTTTVSTLSISRPRICALVDTNFGLQSEQGMAAFYNT